MKLEEIYKTVNRKEVDYQLLISNLKDYARPREKISSWLKSGDLIRVKKGLYIFGDKISQKPYSPELLANLIYGPSAISMQYALSFYGLIPERVIDITCITNKRNKLFNTPVGTFIYRYLNPKIYPIEITLFNYDQTNFFIAAPEKALCDHLYLNDRKVLFTNLNEVEAYLFNDLRIDPTELKKFQLNKLTHISNVYNSKNLKLLTMFIKKWKSK